MKPKLVSIFTLLLLALLSCKSPNAGFIYKDKNSTVEDRVKDLLKRMTLEEKILQMNQWSLGRNVNVNNIEAQTKSFTPGLGSYIYGNQDPQLRNLVQKKTIEGSRLGIPVIFGYDVIHGYRTVYPIPLALACSWNPSLVKEGYSIAAKEARLSGVDWAFAPMIDVSRDPRWGRVAECYGEDPYTNAVFCVAAVKGFQGISLSDPYSVAACLKHFVGYGMSEGGRDYNSTNISAQSLWETYLVPYEAGIKAGAATVMSGFNDINGVPASANHYTLTEVLKEQWGHDGFVVSDWSSVTKLIYQGFAKDSIEAATKALNAGVEMDMVDNTYNEFLKKLVEEKKVNKSTIDDAVRRILRIKFRLGLFDNPYTPVTDTTERFLLPGYRAVAEQLAQESMVLLKNTNGILPLNDRVKNISLIGPMVKDKVNILGSWAAQGKAYDAISIYEGMEKEYGKKININYAKGCNYDGTDISEIDKAVAVARKSDLIVVCLGEKRGWSGENASRSSIALPLLQEQLVIALKKTGKPVVLVLSGGRPVELVRLEPLADAIIEMWQPGVEAGSALAGILSGRFNPSGKLSVTFPLTTGQIPVYYDMRQSSSPGTGKYQDIPTQPLYWFGHGLSYTNFEYDSLRVSAVKVRKSDKLFASVLVTNSGLRTGKETVHWYISDPACSISRPMKELKYFEKKELKPGEKYKFMFEIDPVRDLGYVDDKGRKFLETGDYYIIVKDKKVKIELID